MSSIFYLKIFIIWCLCSKFALFLYFHDLYFSTVSNYSLRFRKKWVLIRSEKSWKNSTEKNWKMLLSTIFTKIFWVIIKYLHQEKLQIFHFCGKSFHLKYRNIWIFLKEQIKTACSQRILTLSGFQVIEVTFLAKKCLSAFKNAPPTFLDILEYLVSYQVVQKVSNDHTGSV